MFLQPIKNDDPQLDFYTMYKRETVDYDTDYLQKHNEDLDTTLIFVCFCAPFITYSIDDILRQVCSPRSAPPSLSTSNRNSSQTLVNGRKPTSEQFSSVSTDPSSPVKTPPHPQCGVDPPRRDRHNLRPAIREFADVTVGRIRRNAWQTVADPVSPTRWRIDGRTLWRPPVQI